MLFQKARTYMHTMHSIPTYNIVINLGIAVIKAKCLSAVQIKTINILVVTFSVYTIISFIIPGKSCFIIYFLVRRGYFVYIFFQCYFLLTYLRQCVNFWRICLQTKHSLFGKFTSKIREWFQF